MESVRVNCQAADCPFYMLIEVNTDDVPEAERGELIKQVREKFTETIKKHHDDGHPREKGKK